MKKIKDVTKRALGLLLTLSLLQSSALVWGEEPFTDVQEQEEQEFTGFQEVPQEQEVVDVPEGDKGSVSPPEEVWEAGLGEGAEEEIFSSFPDTPLLGDGEETVHEEDESLTQEEMEAQLRPMENLREISLVEPPRTGMRAINGGRAYAESVDALPETYDTRGSYTTAVKDQKPFGMCWAFTTAAGMETSLLKNGMGSYDLSEEHLAYFFANRRNDPLGNTPSDRNIVRDSYREGGNQVLAAIFLSTWSGMGLEEEVPYGTDASHVASYHTQPSDLLAYKTTAYLTDAVFSDYNVAKIKSLIYRHGSVGLSLWLDSGYYDVQNNAYCCSDSVGKANHAVTLVGWDDSYSREKFPARCGVKNNGAWIAKNSWGTGWGEEGYFYISYENKANYNIVAEAGTTQAAYPNNYFYDGSSALSSFSLKPSVSSDSSQASAIANIFQANAGKGKAEVLGEVVVGTHSDDSSFGIQIYTNLTDPEDPRSGIPAYPSPVKFYQQYAGIATVPVPEVTLMQNTLYSVVLTNLGGSSLDYLVETEGDYGWVGFQAGFVPGQSFAYSKGAGWSDLFRHNMCLRIKAHTRTLDQGISLEAPLKVKAYNKSYKSIGVSWERDPIASGYEIYRKAPGGSYKKLASVGYDADSWTDKKAKTGTKYTYKVRSYSVLSGQKVYSGFSSGKSARAVPSAPSVAVKTLNSVKNKITWTKVSGAHGYRVYRKAPGKKWELIAEVKGSDARSYTDRNPVPCKSYEYRVRAYRTVKEKPVLGGYKSSGIYKTSPSRQALSSVKNKKDGIRLSWSPQKKSDGYYVYRKTGNGKWSRIAALDKGKTSYYTDTKTKKGKTYTYHVRAYVNNAGKVLQSRYTASKPIKRK